MAFRKSQQAFVLVFICFFSPLLVAELTSFKVTYSVYLYGFEQAEVDNYLLIDKDQYRYESVIKPDNWMAAAYIPSHSESSSGTIINNQIFPESYLYNRGDLYQADKEIRINFDYSNSKIENHHVKINNRWKMALINGSQDRLSSQLSLMLELQKMSGRLEEKTFNFKVADGGRLKNHHYEILHEEKLLTALGTLNTIKLRLIDHLNKETYIWCAEELAYLPVKLVQNRDFFSTYVSDLKSFSSSIEDE